MDTQEQRHKYFTDKQWDQVQDGTMPDGEFGNLMFDGFTNSEPEITEEVMMTIEENFNSYGVTRRTALAVLKQSGKELIDSIKDDRDCAVAFADAGMRAGDYAKKLEAFSEFMKTASVRISLALCTREDMSEIIKEAEKDRGEKAYE